MQATLFLGIAFIAAAPTLKDKSEKENSLLGMWVMESIAINGVVFPANPGAMRWEFTAAGDYSKYSGEKKTTLKYSTDPKADPKAIDLGQVQGIYKVDGDTLTVRVAQKAQTPRPKDFGIPKDQDTALYTFTRVKPAN